jgi:hypothetical protein
VFSFRLSEIVLGSMWIVLQFLSSSVHVAAEHAGMSSVGQLSELSELISQESANSLNVSAIFMGMGSTIFFYLFLRSGYIPRVAVRAGYVRFFAGDCSAFCEAHPPGVHEHLGPCLYPDRTFGSDNRFVADRQGAEPGVPSTQSVKSIPQKKRTRELQGRFALQKRHPLMAQRLMCSQYATTE